MVRHARFLLAVALACAAALALPAVAHAAISITSPSSNPAYTNAAPHLDWVPNGSDSYDVLRADGTCASPTSSFAPLGTVAGPPFDDSPAPAEGTYCYEIDGSLLGSFNDSGQITITYDTTAPGVSITNKPANPSKDPNPTFQFTSPDGTATFGCSLDGGAFAPCTSPHPVGPLGEGSHTFQVYAQDPAGNQSSPASHTWTVDLTAPVTSIDSGPTGPTSDNTPTFTFSSNEPGSTFQCKVDGGAFASCTSPKTLSTLSDGSHTFSVRATDQAGNTDPSPASRTFTVDATPPAVPTALSATTPTSAAPALTWTDADPSVDHYLVFRGATQVGAPSGTSFTDSALAADGTYGYTVKAVDALGNTSAASAPFGVTYDTTNPTTPTNVGAAASPTNAQPHVTWTASTDAGGSGIARYHVFRDGVEVTTVTGTSFTDSLPLDGSADATYTYMVQAEDHAGNVSATSAGAMVSLDTTPPAVPTALSATTPTSASPALAWTDADATVSHYVVLRGATQIGLPASASFTDAALSTDGTYAYTVEAVDALGNTSAPSAPFDVTYDTGAPVAASALTASTPTAAAPDPSWTSGSDPTSGVAREELYRGATLVCTVTAPLPGSVGTKCPAPDASASAGTLSYTVKTYDGAGNVSTSSPLAVVYDPANQTAPVGLSSPVAFTHDAPHLSWGPPASFAVDHYQVYRDGSPVGGAITAPAAAFDDIPLPAEGNHTYKVVAFDASNTPGFDSNSVQVFFDSAAPNAPASLTASARADGSVSLSWPDAIDQNGVNGSGVASYVVRRSVPGGGAPAAPTDGASICAPGAGTTSCTDSTALSGATYAYSVFAVDKAGNVSAAASQSAVHVLDSVAPSAPAGFTGTAGDGTVSLSWTPVAAAGANADLAGYVVVAKTGTTAPANAHDGVAACTVTDVTRGSCSVGGLADGAPVSFTLFSYDEVPNYSSPAGEQLTLTPQAPAKPDTVPPGRPTSFAATSKPGKNAAFLSWANPTDADFDHVVVVQSLGAYPTAPTSGRRIYSGAGTSTSFPEAPGTTVFFSIWAFDHVGNFVATPVKAKLVVPTVSPLSPADGALLQAPARLSWKRVAQASYYNVQVYLGKKRVAIAWPTTTRYSVPKAKLHKHTKYTWYVWPGFGSLAKAKYGTLIGKASFKVK